MIIKNDYIKIRTNKNEYTLHNYIYDKYLEYMAERQYGDILDISSNRNRLKMQRIYIKFDEPFENINNKTEDDFDLEVYGSISQIGSEQTIEVIYEYNCSERPYAINERKNVDIKDYANRKITALGFGNYEILAVLDLSSYSIYVPDDAQLTFTRKDVISTDSICVGYDYPVHLALTTGDYVTETDGTGEHLYEKDARLYSVGFGRTKNIMDEEYIIDTDIDIIKKNATSYGFNLKTGTKQGIYSDPARYCGSFLFPLAPNFKKEIYPSLNFYTGNNKVPMISNYKYIIYKFRLCYWNRGDEFHWLDEYYTMNLHNETKGLFKIITKIERNDNNA